MGAYLRGYPEFFGETPVRDVGLIASEGRMTIPIEDGTPAGILDIRHHYFEFIPEDQADRDEPETVEATELIEGRNYFIVLTTAGGLYRYQISDLVRCVGYHGKAPLIEFLNKGLALLEPDRREALRAPGGRRRASRPAGRRIPAQVVPAPASWADPPYYSLLVEEDDLGNPGAVERLAVAAEQGLRSQNAEYANRGIPADSAPSRSFGSPTGSWAEFQKRRLARSGGKVEQYKQPHLIPDLDQILAFRLRETVG